MRVYSIYPLVDFAGTIAKNGDESINQFYNNIKLLNKRDEFSGVCFNYALENDDIFSCEAAIDCLRHFYIPIAFEDIQPGDIISYHDGYMSEDIRVTANHFAVVIEKALELYNTKIKSKWGHRGVFEGKIFEIPTDYGHKIIFWRKLDKV